MRQRFRFFGGLGFPRPRGPRKPTRILFVAQQYPQLSETYIEVEVRAARAAGLDVAVWAPRAGMSPSPPSAPVHRGTLDAAIAEFRPQLLHIHFLATIPRVIDAARRHALPVTVRAHNFDANAESVALAQTLPSLHRVYLLPPQAALAPPGDARFRTLPAMYESALFPFAAHKDRRLVARTAAALPPKDLRFFLELAAAMPSHRFVLAGVTCVGNEGHLAELEAANRALGSPAEVRRDVPRAEVARLLAEAGVYVHTAIPSGQAGADPIAMPVSIAEAMATGAYVLARNVPPLRDYMDGAGAHYATIDEAATLIRATQRWSDDDWNRVAARAVARAANHADRAAFAAVIEDWRVAAAGVSKRAP